MSKPRERYDEYGPVVRKVIGEGWATGADGQEAADLSYLFTVWSDPRGWYAEFGNPAIPGQDMATLEGTIAFAMKICGGRLVRLFVQTSPSEWHDIGVATWEADLGATV